MAQRSKEVEKAMKKSMLDKANSRNKIIAETCPKIARAFLEVWKYLDTFKDDQIPMEYNMVNDIFGSLDREEITEVFNAISH